jgi:Fic family protein
MLGVGCHHPLPRPADCRTPFRLARFTFSYRVQRPHAHQRGRLARRRAQIQRERKAYYDVLETTQQGTLDVTAWLSWFLGTLQRALDSAQLTLDAVLVKARFWQRWATTPFNQRQVKLLNRLRDGFDGKLDK